MCGLPEVTLRRVSDGQYQAELIGLFLDTDYNALCLHVSQAFPHEPDTNAGARMLA